MLVLLLLATLTAESSAGARPTAPTAESVTEMSSCNLSTLYFILFIVHSGKVSSLEMKISNPFNEQSFSLLRDEVHQNELQEPKTIAKQLFEVQPSFSVTPKVFKEGAFEAGGNLLSSEEALQLSNLEPSTKNSDNLPDFIKNIQTSPFLSLQPKIQSTLDARFAPIPKSLPHKMPKDPVLSIQQKTLDPTASFQLPSFSTFPHKPTTAPPSDAISPNTSSSAVVLHDATVHHYDPLHILREVVDLSSIMAESALSNVKPSIHLRIAGARLRESPHIQQHWDNYLKAHRKNYSATERHQRKRKWLENIIRIHHHNEQARQGLQSYYLGANPLSDMGVREYNRKKVKLTHRGKAGASEEKKYAQQKREVVIPEEWNWVEQGFITPSWDQEDCGSCYAFSVAASAEGQHFRKTKQIINLSAQQLVDCSIATGNHGCNGGSLRNTLRYCLHSRGLMSETNYPYKAKQHGCHFHAHQRRVNVTSYVILPENDEDAIMKAVATVGPVACSINASPYTFQLYQKGIYDDPHCSSHRVNHAMLIVGYTKDVWILKNWWGKDWGENGYMQLRRGKNRCAVGKYAAYPVVDAVPLTETLSLL